MPEKTYIAIDLKSFYASVECRELGKDPLTTNLVVADQSRTAGRRGPRRPGDAQRGRDRVRRYCQPEINSFLREKENEK